MPHAQLRVYCGPEEQGTAAVADHTVTVALGEILPLLADAYNCQRTWLDDFDSDAVTISSDLYEVALAYQHYCRPSA